jgi:hypothetical protein
MIMRLHSVEMLAKPAAPTPESFPKNRLLFPMVLQHPAQVPIKTL